MTGLWRKGISFVLILLMVFISAAISAPAVIADPDPTPTVETSWYEGGPQEYTYDPILFSNPRVRQGGEAISLNFTVGIDWGDATPRAVSTGFDVISRCDWNMPADLLTFDFDPQNPTLIDQTQTVVFTVSVKEGAPNDNYLCQIIAVDLSGEEPSIAYGTGITANIVVNDGGCFIATAAYGTSTATELDTLRAFRDEVLLESTLGSQLVEWYYKTSPPPADFMSEHQALRALVRDLLVEPVAWLVEATGTLWRD